MRRVLIIDDDVQIRKFLDVSLTTMGWEVFLAATSFEGLQMVKSVRPEVIILDLNLPDKGGADTLKELRQWSDLPVLVLSVRNREQDIVDLLNAGADDYLAKPFNTNELMARLAALARRHRPNLDSPQFVSGELRVDFDAHRAWKGDEEIHLTPTEFSIVSILVRNAGRLVTQNHLVELLWGPDSEMERGSLRVHIAAIRKKIEKDSSSPRYLLTEPGIGYRFSSS